MKTLFYSTALLATLAATAVSAQPSVTPSFTPTSYFPPSTPTKTVGYAFIPSGHTFFSPGGAQIVGGGTLYVYNENEQPFTGVIGPTPCKNPAAPTDTVLLNPSQTATVHVPTTGGTDPLYMWLPQACTNPLTIDRRTSFPVPTWSSYTSVPPSTR